MILGLDIGIDYSSLSIMLSLDETTIRRYEKQFLNTEYIDFIKNKYKSYNRKLNKFQLNELKEELVNHLYQTTSQIVDWIEQKYALKYHNQGIIPVLKKLGFVYKKTKLVPAKADNEKQEKFLENFNQLHSSLQSDEVIYFGNATHPQHNTQTSSAWKLGVIPGEPE